MKVLNCLAVCFSSLEIHGIINKVNENYNSNRSDVGLKSKIEFQVVIGFQTYFWRG